MVAIKILASFLTIASFASAVTRLDAESSTGCNITGSPDLPYGQTQLVIPPGQKPLYVGLGVGVQNYTCSGNTYSYVPSAANELSWPP